MTSIERAARWLKYKAGLDDSSAISVAVRPYYNRFLETLYYQRGLERKMAGEAPIRIRPASRYYRDDFETGLFRFMASAVRPGDVILEVGANVGIFTVLLGRWVGPYGHVYAFEPAPEARTRLQDHLRLNRVDGRVTVLPEAISDVPGRSSFRAVGSSGQNALSPNRSESGNPDCVDVLVTTIDAFCAAAGVVSSLIKIDIEGYEIHALRGARSVLARHAPTVVVELHHKNWPEIGVGSEDLQDVLTETQAIYRAESLEENPDSMSPYGHLILLPRFRQQAASYVGQANQLRRLGLSR